MNESINQSITKQGQRKRGLCDGMRLQLHRSPFDLHKDVPAAFDGHDTMPVREKHKQSRTDRTDRQNRTEQNGTEQGRTSAFDRDPRDAD